MVDLWACVGVVAMAVVVVLLINAMHTAERESWRDALYEWQQIANKRLLLLRGVWDEMSTRDKERCENQELIYRVRLELDDRSPMLSWEEATVFDACVRGMLQQFVDEKMQEDERETEL